MTNYQWMVSAGGNILSGSGTSTILVQWTTYGVKILSVNYIGPLGCSAAVPTTKNIQVFPLPVPSIAGAGVLCTGSEGVIYATENGMTDYIWTISPGGTITGGATTNQVTVDWNLTGIQSVGITYTNDKGCTATPEALKSVMVLPLPVPSITGNDSVCLNQMADYLTESGMSGYQWTISAGGTIISGGGSNFIHVLWSSLGTKSVTVNYISSDGCNAAAPGVKTVVVSYLNPTISGATSVCAGTSGVVYTTQPGMVSYAWSVTAGGIITSGLGTNSIHVSWNSAGMQSVSVNYSNSFGCTTLGPSTLPVTVNTLPSPSVSGNPLLCMNSGNYPYTTQPGMTNYSWSISSGGTIISGQGTNSINVNWTTAGANSVMVNYTNPGGCASTIPGALSVTVNSVPATPGLITGETHVCKPKNGVSYSVAPVSLATGYLWNLPPGTIIVNGANTRSITVNYSSGAQPGDIAVVGTNSCGPGAFSPSLPIAVYPYPPTPVISLLPPDTLESSASSGNKWYFENQFIPGGLGQQQLVNKSGHYFVLVNPFGCASDTSNVINAIAVAVETKQIHNLSIYPNPGNGKITIHLNTQGEQKKCAIRVTDLLGKEILRVPEQMVAGEVYRVIDLRSKPEGIYTLILQIGNELLTRKLVVEK
jgi:hypothetical protein